MESPRSCAAPQNRSRTRRLSGVPGNSIWMLINRFIRTSRDERALQMLPDNVLADMGLEKMEIMAWTSGQRHVWVIRIAILLSIRFVRRLGGRPPGAQVGSPGQLPRGRTMSVRAEKPVSHSSLGVGQHLLTDLACISLLISGGSAPC